MKRTIALKLTLSEEQAASLLQTQEDFAQACNGIASYARDNRCWNQVGLHHLSYYEVREQIPYLGSQMVCNAIRKVCGSYKALRIKKQQEVPLVVFKDTSSIHYCARTFSLKEEQLSLFSVNKRIRCRFMLGEHQRKYLACGKIKEGELVRKKKRWFFNIVLDLPEVSLKSTGEVFAVDLGENNLATTSCGTIYGGGVLRHCRDKFLDRRRKLQSNGSKAAKSCLQRISGKERQRVKQTNHCVSKEIVQEAVDFGANVIVLEDLTHIRKRIRTNKRLRTRLHRWSWRELQRFVEYKAEAAGLRVVYVNPQYTSLTCSRCESMGQRHKHLFKCS
ncbi:MAG: hypothetical protein KR126chlam2_01410, partial [Chlamydiae bacterium]|nr:hypothetical protein [Chlamydiota bacterium]